METNENQWRSQVLPREGAQITIWKMRLREDPSLFGPKKKIFNIFYPSADWLKIHYWKQLTMVKLLNTFTTYLQLQKIFLYQESGGP